jgi:heat-inducible transcriptional repressor
MNLSELNQRSREIFKRIVDAYVETGEPVGSRTLSKLGGIHLSPASIRNIMADLEDAGLLAAPHTSAGRIPTDAGLRLFVDGLMEVGHLPESDRIQIESRCLIGGRTMPEVLNEAIGLLSGLSGCAGLVAAPKQDRPLRHIEFVPLGIDQCLVVMVTQDGAVENRLLAVPLGVTPASLVSAGNYLNARLQGRTLAEARGQIEQEIALHQTQLDDLTRGVVEAGLAVRSGDQSGSLIIRGQANLLEDITALEQLEQIRTLFAALETHEMLMRLLESTGDATGVRIFIGAENTLFADAGCSMIVAPYRNSRKDVVGAIGVIGPVRLNYARIIPMVDFTAQIVGKILG